MTLKFSERSEKNLVGVNDRMVKVVRRALELTAVDFTVIEGVRTKDRQQELYAQGRTATGKTVTWTLNSKHIDGLAVDLLPVTGWNDLNGFKKVAAAMKRAADELGIKIRHGADWNGNGVQENGETDWPHFELA